MRRISQWYLAASWLRRFAFNAIIYGVVVGATQVVLQGWVAGLVSGTISALVYSALMTWMFQRKLEGLSGAVGVDPERLPELDQRIRDGAPPESAEEADALRRLVAYRRRAHERQRWMLPLMMLFPIALGGFSLAIGAVISGAGLLALSGVLLAAVVIDRPRQIARLDRMESHLSAAPGPA